MEIAVEVPSGLAHWNVESLGCVRPLASLFCCTKKKYIQPSESQFKSNRNWPGEHGADGGKIKT